MPGSVGRTATASRSVPTAGPPLPRVSARDGGVPLGRASLAGRLANDAALLRLLGRPLLRFLPVLSIGRQVVVSRHADVRDVLERDQEFTIAEVNAATMDRINGPFILGMDRSPQYDRERSILDGCVHPGDRDRIRRAVADTATELVDAAVRRGRIDVVQELARPAVTRLVASYFGVPGPDEATMMHWMRLLFWEAFLNTGGDRAVRRAGERAADEFHAHLDALVADRRAEGDVPAGHDDVLRRLVRAQADPATRLSDEGVRRNISGVVVGAVETTTKVTAHAVDELLRHEGALEGAQRAAREGDIAVVAQYVFEALRFNPLNPALLRHAAHDAVLGRGTRYERTVPAGSRVFVAVLPAMMDPRVFDDPHTFRHDRRPAADLHFGHGMHACFGRYVNLVSIPELVAALLRGGRVHRLPGREGRIRYEGPFPDRLLVGLAPDGGH